MRKILLLLLISKLSISQINISTIGIEYCTFNADSMMWDNCKINTQSVGTFVINKEATIIEHTSSIGISFYYIKSFKTDIIDDKKILSYKLESDTGHFYDLYLDIDSNIVSCIYLSSDDNINKVVYHIKRFY